MSVRDRIRAVAETLREPRSVNWISEQADATGSTTNEEIQDIVDQGQLVRVKAGETTRYQPDYARLLFEEIRTLIEENIREELQCLSMSIVRLLVPLHLDGCPHHDRRGTVSSGPVDCSELDRRLM